MLNVLTTKQNKIKGHKETLGNVGYVYYFDCGDGIMGGCISSNSSDCAH